ncbi:MAG: MgtC/SapB family protein [Oligosphaeraceae bacterium]|nr:MgtC/SapB family protein [Oligosphaeraceae bacterium]
MEMQIFLGRIGLAMILGGVIGIERDIHGRAAGLRTHMLVSVGAALFTLVSLTLAEASGRAGDPGRIAAQVVSGIGFLGAGTILKSGFSVRGLTTAACMWLVAAIGMACATGWLVQATIVAFGVLAVLLTVKRLENRLHRLFSLRVTISSGSAEIPRLMREFVSQHRGITIMSTDLSYDAVNNIHTTVFVVDTMTSIGQLEMSNSISAGVRNFAVDLRSLRIECIS